MEEVTVKKFFCTCVLFFSSLWIATGIVQASEATGEVDYSIQPILPENQLDRGNSFFDLKVDPGAKQALKIQINNFSKSEETFTIKVNTAETNANLSIDYSGNTSEEGTSVSKEGIGKMVNYPNSVTIPGEKAGIVSIELDIPKKKFDGILLGGIQVKKVSSDKKSDGLTVGYDYILGLMLTESEKSVTPKLEFESISPEVINNNAGLLVKMKNSQPMNISDVKMVGNIYKDRDRKAAIITREINGGGIAPSSEFTINFFNGTAGATKPLDSGKYFMTLTFTDGEKNEWHFEKEFSITKREAEEVNTKVFVVKKDNTMLFVIIGVLAAILLILSIFILVYFNRRKEKKS